jgi:hypothetical protein
LNHLKPKILCLSRSYLSNLLPALGQMDNQFEYLHIVQTDKEEKAIIARGGKVILNLQKTIRNGLGQQKINLWKEPEDMRILTGFKWSAIHSDRYLIHFSHDLQIQIAGILQKEIRKIFLKYRFKAFLSEPVALFVTHLIFYYFKKNNVKPLLWCNTYFSGYFYFSQEHEISIPCRSNPMKKIELKILKSRIDEYIDNIAIDKTGPIYHHKFSNVKPTSLDYFKQRKGESPLVLKLGLVSRFIQISRLIRAIMIRINFRKNGDFITAGSISEHLFYLRCLFARNSIYDEMPKKYSIDNVIYPLQFEPEASLLYFAPEIVNQISFVETILKALPHGKILWIKEHPNQFGALDSKKWIELRKKYSNLKFIHGRKNGRHLIQSSSLVITISSTMGLDAIVFGRKLLVAGKVFFAKFFGAKQIYSFEDLSKELNNPSNYLIKKNLYKNKLDLLKFGKYSYFGDPQPSTKLYDTNNLKSIIQAIHLELDT